jgi:hypothetical protein
MKLLLVIFALASLPVTAQWTGIPGAKVDLKAAAPRKDGKPDLSGVWQTDAKYNVNLAADLPKDSVPMTPWARAIYDQRQANLGKEDPEGYCMPPGIPRVNGVPFPQKIVQLPDEIIILYETRWTFRQIHMDGRAPIADAQPTWMGYSVGHWEDETLVVTTSGFNEKTWLDDDGHPHTEAMKVTERMRRPDVGHLVVEITIEDAKAYTKPWTVRQTFDLLPGSDLLEYVCSENNLDIPHLVGK